MWSVKCGILKPRIRDKRLYGAGTSRGVYVDHSEVKFVYVRIPCVSTWVRHWSLRAQEKYGYSHWPIPNVQRPSHSQSQWQCGCVGEHQIVCGDWLVCQTIIAVYNSAITYMYSSNSGSCISCVRNSDGHIELGSVWPMDPPNSVDGPQVVFACPLNPHFAHSATHL